MPAYTEAIKAGAGSIMVSFSSWNGKKMHGHKYLLTDVLKGELGFKGFLISDWAAEHRQVARECVQQSLVLLKNADRALPLAKNLKRVHVVGKAADDLGTQCGGWACGFGLAY